MKRLLLGTSLAVLALSSSAAFADSGRKDHGKNEKHRTHQEYRHDDRHDNRRDDRHDNGRHLGWQKQAFHRGQRVPVIYLQPRYYVQDYRTYRLSAPPAGYRWVRPDDGRYLLIQTTTGLISQMLGY